MSNYKDKGYPKKFFNPFSGLLDSVKNALKVGSGCKCQSCGEYYRVEIIVSGKLWNRVKPEGWLCGKCVVSRLEQLGEFRVFKLIDVGEIHKVLMDSYNLKRIASAKCNCSCHIPSGNLCESPYCCEDHWFLEE